MGHDHSLHGTEIQGYKSMSSGSNSSNSKKFFLGGAWIGIFKPNVHNPVYVGMVK